MPDLSGVEVLRRLREAGSRVPVVFTSGFHEVPPELERSSYQGFLVKPYRLEELFAQLEVALTS
jgi:two-component system response regulator MprA